MMGDRIGPYRINPAFDRFPEEGRLIGKLLAGFGEIEVCVCRNAGYAANMQEDVMKALYRLRATSSRFEAADALARRQFGAAGLSIEYQTAYDMVAKCLKLRNQFAHCNWADSDTLEDGLFFTDLQAWADASDGFEYAWRNIDITLLKEHELYFAYTMEWLQFVYHELRTKRGTMPLNSWPRPPTREPPQMHNLLEKHIPPWLNEDQKARHLARALATQGGAPTPTPKQQDLDKARETKRARRQADRDASKRLSLDPQK